jgi:hypothetical protein
MSLATRARQDLITTQKLFNTATVSVGCLYLTTQSVTVTVIGAIAGTAVTGWTMWLERSQKRSISIRCDCPDEGGRPRSIREG